MKVELVKQNGKTVGWTLIAETTEDRLRLGSIRNMQFFGIKETAITYGGVMSWKEDTKYVQQLAWIQKCVSGEFSISKLDDNMNMPTITVTDEENNTTNN